MIRKFLIILGVFALMPAVLLAVAGGAFAATVRIVVPAHDIARGDTISESDLTYATVDGAQLISGIPTKMDEVKGMQARRTLAAGQAFRADDVRRPIVITKGQTVTMEFDAPGVQLTAMGRAMSEGGVGDTVTVQNPASYRMISAIVTAPGTVRATGIIAAPANSIARR
jgi:flagella basal body P-ring formation protein FlgA